MWHVEMMRRRPIDVRSRRAGRGRRRWRRHCGGGLRWASNGARSRRGLLLLLRRRRRRLGAWWSVGPVCYGAVLRVDRPGRGRTGGRPGEKLRVVSPGRRMVGLKLWAAGRGGLTWRRGSVGRRTRDPQGGGEGLCTSVGGRDGADDACIGTGTGASGIMMVVMMLLLLLLLLLVGIGRRPELHRGRWRPCVVHGGFGTGGLVAPGLQVKGPGVRLDRVVELVPGRRRGLRCDGGRVGAVEFGDEEGWRIATAIVMTLV